MTDLAKMKKDNRDLLSAERAQKKSRLSARPPQWQIEPTSRCNLQCTSCGRMAWDPDRNPPGDITPEVLDAVGPHLAAAESVVVGGYGEPLLSPMLETVLQSAADARCSIALITNGTRLDKNASTMIAGYKPEELVVSVDAVNPMLLLGLRGASIDVLRKNVERFKQMVPGCRTVYQMTIGKHNINELPGLIRIAAQDGCEIRVAHVKAYTMLLRDAPLFDAPELLSQTFEDAATLARQLDVAMTLPPSSGRHPCLQPFEMLAVRHDGTVQGCCSAMFNADVPHLVLGKLPGDDPDDLWNHELMRAARTAAYGDGEWPEPCVDCAFRTMTQAAHRRILDG